jgi:hypothetical protein
MIADIIEHMLQRTPLVLMARILLERAMDTAHFDDLFKRMAVTQYTRTALFSNIIALLMTVTTRMHRSVGAAYHEHKGRLGVSLVALCGKLKRTDLPLMSALVRENSERLGEVISELRAELAPLVRGYRTRIVDGNALGATEHRLDVLRDTRSGPLPGKALVVFDYERDITTEILPCEDGHAQERSLFRQLAALVRAGELWIADRNFCTKWFLKSIVARGAAFLIRQHGKLRVTSLSELVFKGNCEGGGTVFEQDVRIGFGDDAVLARRIVVFLGTKTRDGDGVLTLLTSLPPDKADAVCIANWYRKRWRIETMFKELTTTLRCEVKELGSPRAALLVFAVAILSANLHATIRAALRVAHGNEVAEQISTYLIVEDLEGSYRGSEQFDHVVDWEGFTTMPLQEFAELLGRCARNINPKRYPKARKYPRQRSTKTQRGKPDDPPHVSTYRLLRAKQAMSNPGKIVA